MQIIATRVSLSNGESSFYRNVKNFCSLRVICSTIRRNNEFFVERVSPVISEAVLNVCRPTSAPWKHSSLERHDSGCAHTAVALKERLFPSEVVGIEMWNAFITAFQPLLPPGERHTSFLHLFFSEYDIHNSLEGCYHSCPMPRAVFCLLKSWLNAKINGRGKVPIGSLCCFPMNQRTHTASGYSACYPKTPHYARSWAHLRHGDVKEPSQSFILCSAAAVEGRFATQAHSAGRGGWASLLAIDPCLPARIAAFNSLPSSVGGLLFPVPATHADRCPPRVICRSLRGFRPSCLHATISISLTILLPEKRICRSGSITVQTFINSPQAYTIIGRGPLTEGEDHAVVLRLCTAVMQSMMAGVEGAARGTTLPHTLC